MFQVSDFWKKSQIAIALFDLISSDYIKIHYLWPGLKD
jgi:hypothetical protein